MAERCIDFAKVGHVEQDERHRRRRRRAQQFLKVSFCVDAIGQTGERIVMRVVTDARLAFRDILLHGIERCRQTAELISAAHVNGLVVSARLDTARGTHQLANGPGRATTQQQRDREGGAERDAANGHERVALRTERGHHYIHRLLQDDDCGLGGIAQSERIRQVVIAAERACL